MGAFLVLLESIVECVWAQIREPRSHRNPGIKVKLRKERQKDGWEWVERCLFPKLCQRGDPTVSDFEKPWIKQTRYKVLITVVSFRSAGRWILFPLNRVPLAASPLFALSSC